MTSKESYTKHLEEEIVKYDTRIKKIKDNPDPYRMRSNLMLYEIERDQRIYQLESAKAGKPVASGGGAILRAMGFAPYSGGAGAADRLATGNWRKYWDMALANGFPELGCDRTILGITLVSSGDIPPVDFVVAFNGACQPLMHSEMATARHFKVPVFVIDRGFDLNEENLKYVAEQFGELVEFAESKFPGMKLDMARLEESLYYAREGEKVYHDIYELRKRKPCPINPRDAQYERGPIWGATYPDRMLKYLQTYRDELYERAEKGIGRMKEERVRVLWTCVGLNYDVEIYKWMSDQGVSMPFYQYGIAARTFTVAPWHTGYLDETEFGRKLTPFEEEAKFVMQNSWNGRGERWIKDVLWVAKDLECDGIVHMLQTGCRQVIGLSKLLADASEKELGVPVLNVECRGIIPEGYSTDEWRQKLSGFFDLCEMRKPLRKVSK